MRVCGYRSAPLKGDCSVSYVISHRRNSGFVAFERRDEAEKGMHALADSNLEGRILKLMWAKAVKVSSGASGTTGTAVIVSKEYIMEQKGSVTAGGRVTGRRGAHVRYP